MSPHFETEALDGLTFSKFRPGPEAKLPPVPAWKWRLTLAMIAAFIGLSLYSGYRKAAGDVVPSLAVLAMLAALVAGTGVCTVCSHIAYRQKARATPIPEPPQRSSARRLACCRLCERQTQRRLDVDRRQVAHASGRYLWIPPQAVRPNEDTDQGSRAL